MGVDIDGRVWRHFRVPMQKVAEEAMPARPVLTLKPARLVLLFLAACLSLTTAPPLSAETLPQSSVDQKVKDFMALVSAHDFDSSGLVRAEGPLRVVVVSLDQARDTPIVEQKLSVLRSDTGLDIEFGDEATIAVFFTKNPKEDLKGRYLPLVRRIFSLHHDPREILDQFADSEICLRINGTVREGDRKVIAGGLIALREGLDGATIHGCLSQSFYGLVGFHMMMKPGRPSVFSKSSSFWEPMELDRELIRTLYDRRLRSGMMRAEVEAQVKAILSDSKTDDSTEVLNLFSETAVGEPMNDDIVRKWDTPIRAVLQGPYSSGTAMQVARRIERLAKATGLDFRLAEKDEEPNLFLLFSDDPQADLTGPYRALATRFFDEPIEKEVADHYDPIFGPVQFTGNSITSALVGMPRPRSPAMFDWNFSRALASALGIVPRAYSNRRSALSNISSTIYLTETDLRVISTLYAPEVRAGMNRDEAIEAARVAIARISASRQR